MRFSLWLIAGIIGLISTILMWRITLLLMEDGQKVDFIWMRVNSFKYLNMYKNYCLKKYGKIGLSYYIIYSSYFILLIILILLVILSLIKSHK
jgi:hypothetical protein